MDKVFVPILFAAVIIIFLIYFGALANRKPKLWFLGVPLFLVGLAITILALDSRSPSSSAQVIAALVGLPFIVGFFGQKFMGNASIIARLFGSALGAGTVAMVTTGLNLGITSISVTSVVTALSLMLITSFIGG